MLTDKQIEAALEYYSDPLYPITEMLYCYVDTESGKRTGIPFHVLVAECRERKWWAEQSIRLLRAIVDGWARGNPMEAIDAAREMLKGEPA